MKKILFILCLAVWCTSSGQLSKPDKKILFVVSNAHYYGDSKINTANHFAEIVLAYKEFIQADYEVDIISPKGGRAPLSYIYSDQVLQEYLFDSDFMSKLNHTKRPDDVLAEDYVAIYFPGGGAAMFGIHDNKHINKLAKDIYEQPGGIISAVCHGTAGIAEIKLANGRFLVAGKKVSGFPDLFENKEADYFKTFPFSIEERVVKNGGEFLYSTEGWDEHYVIDDKLITGQDPTSSAGVAQAVIKKIQQKQLSQTSRSNQQ